MALMQFPRLADQIVKKAITSLNLNFIVDFSCSLSARASAGLGLVTRSWYVRILLEELCVLFDLFEDSVNPSGITLWPSWPYNNSSQIVETDAICLEFSPDFLHSLFTPLFSLKCAPLLPQCWATRILEHWDDCNPKSTLGRGKITQVFQDLWRVF